VKDERDFMPMLDYLIKVEIEKVRTGAPKAKSPGLPWSNHYPDNLTFVNTDYDVLFEAVKSRILLLGSDVCLESLDAIELVDGNYTDPVRTFVKNELHSEKKLNNGKVRLVFNVSVVDLIIERILFDAFNKTSIKHWTTSPSLPGMGFDDAKYAGLVEMMNRILIMATSDVSGMDFTVAREDMIMYFLVCSNNSGAFIGSFLYRAMWNRILCFGRSEIHFSNGLIIKQMIDGFVKSGGGLTSSMDSFTRWSWGCVVGIKSAELRTDGTSEDWLTANSHLIHAMGDDCFEPYVEGAIELYRQYGVTMKEYLKSNLDDGLDFCGHTFSRGPCKLLRWEKSLAEMLQKFYPTEMQQHESFAGIMYELRHQPDVVEIFKHVFDVTGWWLHSK